MDSEHQFRAEAVHRLKSRAAFWPAWAMFGMGVALVFMGVGLSTRRDGEITEDKISAEMATLRQQS